MSRTDSSTTAQLVRETEEDADGHNGRGLRRWRRVVLGLFVALVCGACALSLWPDATARAAMGSGSATLTHPPFVRAGIDSSLTLSLPDTASGDDWVEVLVPHDLAAVLAPTLITPTPTAQHSTSRGWALTFPSGTQVSLSGRVPVDQSPTRLSNSVELTLRDEVPDAPPRTGDPDAVLRTTLWVLP